MPDPHRLRANALTALAALTLLGAAGCGSGGPGLGPTGGRGEVAFESCGETVRLDGAPRRVAILNDGIADTLFALGVGERIVAKTRGESAPLPELAARLAALPSLGTRSPSPEALLAARADLVITDQVAKVSGVHGSPSIAELEQLGIATYVAGGSCVAGLADDSAGLEALFADLDQLGTIFGVEARARALAARLRGRLDAVRRRTAAEPKPGVVEIQQVAGQLYVTTGGTSNDVIERAGGNNLFADLAGQYAAVSLEQLVARNPAAIIVDRFTVSTSGQRETIAFLTRTLPSADAVEQGRILVIDAAKSGARGSIRPVDGVVEIARFLHPRAFVPQQRDDEAPGLRASGTR